MGAYCPFIAELIQFSALAPLLNGAQTAQTRVIQLDMWSCATLCANGLAGNNNNKNDKLQIKMANCGDSFG